jgi:hypothetical protein
VEIETPNYTLGLDGRTGGLRSLRSASGREMLHPLHATLPLFEIQYLDERRRFRRISSETALSCEVGRTDGPDGTIVDLSYARLGGHDIDARVTLRLPRGDRLSYWSLSLDQRTPMIITDVQFPFVVVPYRYEDGGPTSLLVPTNTGELYRWPRPEQLLPDYPDTWQFTEERAKFVHYPGTTFAQFLAYYDERQGVYLACHDVGGRVKIIKPVHRRGGIRLGIAHVVGWDEPSRHDLGYEVALGVFTGDWYDAADMYRRWYEREAEQGQPLSERRDVPPWLLDSPLHTVLRIQGELDAGPAEPHPEFVPYENALPLLDRLSEKVDAPLTPIIMSWERHGPWVYPDCFPVVGGDDALRSFTAAARSRGWHVGTYCNGMRWVIGHKWTGYEGRDYYENQRGEDTVCRLPDGTPWREVWDRDWRPSYMCCTAAPRTQDIAAEYVRRLLDLGLDWVQFLDQNCGAASFPCYGEGHGHPSAPGHWMTPALAQLLARLEGLAGAADREIVFSVENAPNDHFRHRFQICDIRPDLEGRSVPLFQYLFHEHILTQGAFALAPNPYWMRLKTAHSFVLGDVMTAIVGPGGRLMNWAGRPWASWDTPAGDQEAILTLLRRAIGMRRGSGRDFLVFGRLLRPYPVHDIEHLSWSTERGLTTMPAVMHACWKAPDGRTAIALANWTKEEQVVRLGVSSEGLSPRRYHLRGDAARTVELDGTATPPLVLPPLGVALVECGEAEDPDREGRVPGEGQGDARDA